ncbi:sugar ABC transporter substrate-binding protein [Jiangella alba]|uniref:Ribose transport system substrate-binding protein n=1 Tax=Jiangella alba TaxID=561176 RepID=A0A1H5JNT9_9ACTN|nr:sugar ABC transporter substrate-binding protein [Jiangella alba]SEE54094.1 ribose transport system substrate-binding protein [Jiangella alba]
MNQLTRTATAVVCACAVAGGLAACSARGEAATDAEIKVMYLLPTLNDEAYSREAAGARAEADRLGVEVDVQAGPQRRDPSPIIAKVEDAITQQFDVIVVDPGEYAAQLSPVLNKAEEAGIDVISMIQEIPDLEPTVHIAYDESAGYRAAGEYMGELLPEGGELGVIGCGIGNAQMDGRRSAFADGLPANITQVQIGETQCDPTKARKLTENMLTAHPELAGIFSDTDIALLGGIEALRAAGADLAVIGGDGQTANLELISNGEIQDASTSYPSEIFGATAIQVASRLAADEDVAALCEIPSQPLITEDTAAQVLALIEEIDAGSAQPEVPDCTENHD